MFTNELRNNKIFAILILVIGILTVFATQDAAFFIMSIIISLGLFLSKKNWIY